MMNQNSKVKNKSTIVLIQKKSLKLSELIVTYFLGVFKLECSKTWLFAQFLWQSYKRVMPQPLTIIFSQLIKKIFFIVSYRFQRTIHKLKRSVSNILVALRNIFKDNIKKSNSQSIGFGPYEAQYIDIHTHVTDFLQVTGMISLQLHF